MKYSQLSNFQKQQYTNYLETQLQKFSSFMLTQKRENEKYRILEDAIAYQTDTITQMKEKVQLVQLYQMQNHANFEHLSKKVSKIEDLQSRLRRLEDRQKFGCDDESNIKRKKHTEKQYNSSESEGEMSRLASIDKNYKECMKIIKRQQVQLDDCQFALNKMRKKRSSQSPESHINPEFLIQKKDLKKLQKKMMRYFNEKFEEVEATMQRRKSKSSKSPTPKGIELSIIDNYTIKDSKKEISSFRIDDSMTNKSEISTILQSKSTKKSKASEKSQKQTKKKRNSSKSRSKSHDRQSKSLSKSKSKHKDKSKSKSKKEPKEKQNKHHSKKSKNKSLNVSDESIFLTSKSRSRSHTSQHKRQKSKDSKVSKHSKLSKKGRNSTSRQKSHSNSHDLCKMRPQMTLYLPLKISQKKTQEIYLGQRKPIPLKRHHH